MNMGKTDHNLNFFFEENYQGKYQVNPEVAMMEYYG